MADFRKLLTGLSFQRVETYIQSGNAVVDAKGSAAQVGAIISDALQQHMGAPLGVIVRTHEQLERVIQRNPFAREAAGDGSKVHVAFLAGSAGPGAHAALQKIVDQYPKRRDRYYLAEDHVYFHFPDGAAETKFTGSALQKAIGVIGTGRNWNTVIKLHQMSDR